MNATYLLTSLVGVMILGIFAHIMSSVLRIPSVVLLLIAGIILGPEVTGLIQPESLGNSIELLVSFSVAIIVFDGGLDIDLRELKKIRHGVMSLVSIGIIITVTASAIVVHLLLNLPIGLALLFGALISATGPTVITPLLKQTRVNTKVSNTLQVESVVSEGVSVILAALVFEAITTSITGIKVLDFLLMRLLTAIFFGVLSGIVLMLVLRNIPMLTESHARLFTISILMAAFVSTEVIGNQSGIMTMALLGMFMGSSDIPHKKTIKEFKEDISIILLSLIFILLSTLIDFDSIKVIGFRGVVFVGLLMFIIRPLTVFVSTHVSDLKTGEKLFISLMGPRGVVPASMAVYFSIRLMDMGFVSESTTLLGLMFITIIITVISTGILASFIAKKTGVIPMEIMIIGGGEVGRTLAERFMKRGENVVIIDSNEENCKKAMELGVKVVKGDAEDIAVLKKAGIENSKYLVATTDQDNTNLLVCQIAKTKFNFTEDKLVARVNKPENLKAFRDLGIRSISPVIATSIMLEGMVGHPALFSICEVSGEGDIHEIKVSNKHVIGKNIKNISLPKDTLIVMVRRNNRFLIAHGDTILQEGDIVTIIGKTEAVQKAAEMLK